MEESEASTNLGFEDPNSKLARLEKAEKLVTKLCQKKIQLNKNLSVTFFGGSYELRGLTGLEEGIRRRVARNRKKLDVLEVFLKKQHFANKAFNEKPSTCLSRNELDQYKLHFKMLHGRKKLAKEKHLLREIKAGQGQQGSLKELNHSTWRKYRQMDYEKNRIEIAEDCLREIEKREELDRTKKFIDGTEAERRIRMYLGSKKAIRDQIKVIRLELDELRKMYVASRKKAGPLVPELVAIHKEENSLRKKLIDINPRKGTAYEDLLQLKYKQQTEVQHFGEEQTQV